jgi:hypothetical protein
MEQVKCKHSSGMSNYRCRNGNNNSPSKTTKRKRSAAATSTNDTLYDEYWGVSISTFLILNKKLTIFFYL